MYRSSVDGKTVTLYDQTSNTAYRLTLPPDHATSAPDSTTADTPPTVAKIKDFISRLAGTVDVSGAIPDNVAGREAYTVRLAPKHDGGLVGAAELSWDAVTGTPLRAAVYAAGSPSPVLELTATDISYRTGRVVGPRRHAARRCQGRPGQAAAGRFEQGPRGAHGAGPPGPEPERSGRAGAVYAHRPRHIWSAFPARTFASSRSTIARRRW